MQNFFIWLFIWLLKFLKYLNDEFGNLLNGILVEIMKGLLAAVKKYGNIVAIVLVLAVVICIVKPNILEYVPGSAVEVKEMSSVKIEYPTVPDDLIKMTHPDGDFDYVIPENFFEKESYNKKSGVLKFNTADNKTAVLKLIKKDVDQYYEKYPDTKDNLEELAKVLYEKDKNTMISPLSLARKVNVAENGDVRYILSGDPKNDPDVAHYICRVFIKDTIYTLFFKYYTGEKTADEMYNEKTPITYVYDCLYRGWGISGTSNAPRTYADYQINQN